ncbi:MAG: TetR/AcrR family transcriptional regulator [Candidatus Hermodarchaeota archaeon]
MTRSKKPLIGQRTWDRITTQDRREREKLRRRNNILEAAERRFFEKGFDEVSMDDIAKDLQLSKGTLYLYFKNKQSLYFAVVIKGIVILRDTFRKAVESETTGLKKILAIVQSFYGYLQAHSDYYLLNLAARGERFVPMFDNNEIEDVETYIALVVELLNLLKNAVTLGIEDCSLRKDLDPLQTTIFLGMAIEAVVRVTPEYQGLLQQSGLTTEEYIQHSIDVLLRGIAGEKSDL